MGRPANGQPRIPPNMQPWIEARKRFRLSHAHVQMAREQGLNPNKLGKLDNHDRELWKQPLPDFIATLYRKHFGRERPETVRTIEEMAAAKQAKKQAKKEAKAGKANETERVVPAGEAPACPRLSGGPAGHRGVFAEIEPVSSIRAATHTRTGRAMDD